MFHRAKSWNFPAESAVNLRVLTSEHFCGCYFISLSEYDAKVAVITAAESLQNAPSFTAALHSCGSGLLCCGCCCFSAALFFC